MLASIRFCQSFACPSKSISSVSSYAVCSYTSSEISYAFSTNIESSSSEPIQFHRIPSPRPSINPHMSIHPSIHICKRFDSLNEALLLLATSSNRWSILLLSTSQEESRSRKRCSESSHGELYQLSLADIPPYNYLLSSQDPNSDHKPQ